MILNFSDYFENAGKDVVFLLSEEFAIKAWDTEINAGSRTFFHLPDNCWLISQKTSHRIGDWMEAFNKDRNFVVEELLRETLNWQDKTMIRFFISRKFVLQTRWCDFLHIWDEFLALEDDCPIIVPKNYSGKESIVFTPLGDIIKLG